MRLFFAIVFAFLLAASPSANAADPAQTVPLTPAPPAQCNTFSDYFLWGNPADYRCPAQSNLPACADPNVLAAADRYVDSADPAYIATSLAELTQIREVPQTVIEASPLTRRYCTATALLTNGNLTTAYYFLQEDAGPLGLSWKVYVCLIGYDDWRVYDGQCRVAQPPVVY